MRQILYILFCTLTTVLFSSCKSSFIAIERGSIAQSDEAFISYLKNKGIETSDSNSVELLNGAHAKFKRLLSDISRAKHHIHLEYFNFRNDSINAVVIGALAKKAAEGVEVRALFDDFGNLSNNKPLKKRHIEAIREKGIQIEKFDPIKFPWVNHINHRDHRKIVVIDGRIGYIGGINVADYYLTGLEGVGKWRDMHARVEGNAVSDLQRVFLDMWNHETGEKIGGNSYFPTTGAQGASRIAVVDRCPPKTANNMRRSYANAINAAKDSIQIVSPYFIPTYLVRRAIKKALKDSVKVEIMISSKSDISFTPDATMYTAYKLMKKGATVHMYDGGFNHAKVMAVDGTFCTIGSANLNSRSLRYDYECNIFIFDKEETGTMIEYFHKDKEESFPMTRKYWKSRPLWNRFCGWLGYLLTPFM